VIAFVLYELYVGTFILRTDSDFHDKLSFSQKLSVIVAGVARRANLPARQNSIGVVTEKKCALKILARSVLPSVHPLLFFLLCSIST
jgi:hypothetical protein